MPSPLARMFKRSPKNKTPDNKEDNKVDNDDNDNKNDNNNTDNNDDNNDTISETNSPPKQAQPKIGKSPTEKVVTHIIPSLAPRDIEEPKAEENPPEERFWWRWFTGYWGPWYNKESSPEPPFKK